MKTYDTVPTIRWKGICLKCHQPVIREGIWRDGRWWHSEHAPSVKPVQYRLDMNPAIAKGDMKFLSRAAEALGVGPVKVEWSESKRKWPDIWVQGKTITVTQEWAKQDADERRKRLVHELEHLHGERHGRKGKLMYSTLPAKDSYSRVIYDGLKKRLSMRNPGERCLKCGEFVDYKKGFHHAGGLWHEKCLNKERMEHSKAHRVMQTGYERNGHGQVHIYEKWPYESWSWGYSEQNPEVLPNTGTWFWQEHRTKEERARLYRKLREAGADPEGARKFRDYQPYKLRRAVLPYHLKPETAEHFQAIEELKEMISPERLREMARQRREERNPKGRSLFPFLLAAALIGIPYWLYKRNQKQALAGTKTIPS